MTAKKKPTTKIEQLRQMALAVIAAGGRCEPDRLEGKASTLRILLNNRGDYDRVWLAVSNDGTAELQSRLAGTVKGSPAVRYAIPDDFSDVWDAAFAYTLGAEIDRIHETS
jgi:hypothetical protein